MFWEEKELKKEQLTRRKKQPKQRGTRRIVLNVLIVVLACVFLYSAYRLYGIVSVYYHNWKLQSQIQELFYQQPDEETDRVNSQDVVLTNPLEPIQQFNDEVVGWISIPDTTVDYPVVQGSDNEYYLNHNINGESTICGSIFLDYRNNLESGGENYVLYGHRMKDDSMFGNLAKFLQEDFYKCHQTFTLITEKTTYTCEIFAVYQTTTAFYYNQPQFSGTDEYMSFIESCRSRSMYTTNIEITADDSILTLSTCDYKLDAQEGRLVVQAKLVPEE